MQMNQMDIWMDWEVDLTECQKGVYKRGFSALAVVYLADVPETNSGNFTVWPKSHSFFADYFEKEGHEVLANGMPRPDLPEGPTQITGNAGDVVLTHHQVVHFCCSKCIR